MRHLILSLSLCLTPISAFAQDDDKGILTRFLEDTLSEAGRTIEINGFAGALSSRATVGEIIISDPEGPWLTLRGIVLDWNRAAVLRGRVEIGELSAEEILIPRLPVAGEDTPSPAADEPFSLPDLPVSVDIGQIAAQRVVLGEALFGQAAEVTLNGAISLISGDGNADISLARIDGRDGELALQGAYLQDSGQLTLDLSLTEGAGGIAVKLLDVPDEPSVALTIRGDDPISDFTASVTLATDGTERLAGDIATNTFVEDGATEPSRGFRVDLGGDLAPILAPDYRPFFGDTIALVATGQSAPDGTTVLEDFTLSAAAIDLAGSATIAANGLPRAFDLDGVIADNGAPVLLPLGGEPTEVTRAAIIATFDAEAGERWTANIALADLVQEELSLTAAQLAGAGTISGIDSADQRRVTADITFEATEFSHANADLQTALGADFTGAADLIWQDGAPLVLNALTLGGDGYGIEAAATVDGFDGAFEIDGRAAANVADLSRYAGLAGQPLAGAAELTISGAAALLTGAFDAEIDLTGTDIGIGNVEVDRLLSGTSTIALAATRDTTGLAIERLSIAAQELSADLSGTLEPEAGSFDLTARLSDIAPYVPGLSGPITLDGLAVLDSGTWTLDMDADAPGGTAARIDGTLSDLDGDLTVNGTAQADITDLAAYADLLGRPVTGSIRFEAVGSGAITPRAFDITADATGTDLAIGETQIDPLIAGQSTIGVTARGTPSDIEIDRFTIATPELTADLSGSAMLPDTGAFVLTARLADIARFVPDLSGPLTLDGAAILETGTWTLNMDADGPGGTTARIDGTVSELDGDIAVAGRATADITTLSAFADLAQRPLSGSVTLSAEGNGAVIPRRFDVTLDATTQDLATGIAQADALLAGQSTLGLTANGDLSAVQIDRFALNTPQITADVTGALNQTNSALDLTASLSDIATVLPELSGAGSLSGTARQNGTEWEIDLDATGPGDLRASVDGTVDDPLNAPAIAARASARIATLTPYAGLAKRNLGGAIELTVEGTGALEPQSFDVTARVLGSDLRTGSDDLDQLLTGESTVDLKASGVGNVLTLEQLDVETRQLTAALNGTLDDANSRFDLDARLADVALFAPEFPGAATVTATAARAGPLWQLEADATGPGQTSANLNGSVSESFDALDLAITGQAALGLANRFISPRSVEGTAQFDLGVNGPPELASLSGTVRTGGARVALPALDFALTDLGATITLANGAATIDLDTLSREGGQISVNGPITLSAPYNANLAIALRSLILTDPALYETSANGDLTITGPLTGSGQIAGRIDLGRTEVQVPSTGLGGGGYVPEGLQHIGEPAAVRTTRSYAGLLESSSGGSGSGGSGGLGLDLLINATNPIFLRGRGLDAEFGGELRIAGTTSAVVPIGRFDLRRGRLDLLGQRLTIEEGYAQLQGDFVPFIYLEATSQTDTILVRILIEGPADEPEITFTSEPELPEDEVLAQFLFGRDLTQLSALQAAQLASAVRTLAGRGGTSILERLRTSLGLDDFDVTSSDDGGTAVRAGKYLSDNVYSDVVIDENGESEVTINLDINENITVRGSTTSDGETGLGVFFQKDY